LLFVGLCFAAAPTGGDWEGRERRDHPGARLAVWREYCHSSDCPEFELVTSSNEIEIRRYNASYWISAEIKDTDFGRGLTLSFLDLLSYLRGRNSRNVEIEMALPVVLVIPGDVQTMTALPTTGLELMMYLDEEVQMSPPTPSRSDVTIFRKPPCTVAVSAFDGFANPRDILEEGQHLAQRLTTAGIQFNHSMFIFASYDDPTDMSDRHNEVMLVLTGDRSRTGGTGAGSGTNTGAGSGTNAGAGSGTNTGAGSGTNAGAGSGTNAGAGSGTNTGAGSGTNAGNRAGAGAGETGAHH